MNYQKGDLILSAYGRDKGQKYFVWMVKENNVLLVNGKTKKIANPKIKNLKHITLYKKSDEIFDSLYEGQNINDAYLRKILNDD